MVITLGCCIADYFLQDVIDTAGMVTAAGAAVHKERVPETDALVVQRLRQAGTSTDALQVSLLMTVSQVL